MRGVATTYHRESGSGLQKGECFLVTEGEEECRQVGDSMYRQERRRVVSPAHAPCVQKSPWPSWVGRRGSN